MFSLPQIMGILNVTPDSFSDGGQFNTVQSALDQATLLIDSGADIIDIGGESTRPFSTPVTLDEELQRTIPVIQAIRKTHSIPISIDTSKAEVAHQALLAGADIVNDVTALSGDTEMAAVISETNAPVILMHMQKNPEQMQLSPVYKNVVQEIMAFFTERIAFAESRGIHKEQITLDPGIGFGKTTAHNLSLLKHLEIFSTLGCPVLLGHSRKRFIGDITGRDTEQRDIATAVVSAFGATKNISILRVHNVSATKDALLMTEAIDSAPDCSFIF